MTEADLETASAETILRWAYNRYGRVALVASFQAEAGVLIDMACRIAPSPEVLTLDTGRLPQETHNLMDVFRERYPIRLRVVSPDADELQAMTSTHGVNLFRQSVELRHECCAVRKVHPLRRALSSFDAWITGLRRDQSEERAAVPIVAPDDVNGGIAKVAPLARWSSDDVWSYIAANDVPRHPLYARGYTSIGCAPCTRATAPGEEERAGRWWWEREDVKECGLHPVALEAAL